MHEYDIINSLYKQIIQRQTAYYVAKLTTHLWPENTEYTENNVYNHVSTIVYDLLFSMTTIKLGLRKSMELEWLMHQYSTGEFGMSEYKKKFIAIHQTNDINIIEFLNKLKTKEFTNKVYMAIKIEK